MTAPILVTGGTGTLGRQVVPRLRDGGHEVRVLSRGNRQDGTDGIELVAGDLSSGDGVEAAVDGTEVILHLAGTTRGDEVKAANLVRAASRAGTRHLVFISVVGADRIPVVSAVDRAMFGYFASKRAAEQVIADAGLPWTTLRATQFHDLALLTVRQLARLPVVPVPAGWRFQPVDAGEVADRLVELARGAPAGLVPDLGGPRTYELAELVRGYLRATHRHRPILPVWTPGGAARAVRAGANLAPDRAVGHRTWEEFLAERVSPGATRRSPVPMTGTDRLEEVAMTQHPRLPRRVRFFSPILKFLLVAGIPMGPNGLVTIRGRKSGLPRTTPLAIIEVGGRRWVWAPWGEVQWVRNLRAAGRATIAVRGRKEEVSATELDPTQRVGFFRDILGPHARGIPLGVWFIRIVDGVDLDHPVEAAEGRRVFEFHPIG
jgi:deazaflavin-dependent oxidoreductase (nitroreductase family)